MSRYYILLILSLFSLSVLAQNVTNVRGMQEGTNIVLLYDLQEDAQISEVYIEIDGKSRLVPSSCLSGDVNKTVTKGQNRRIVYDVLSDYTNGLTADRIAFVVNGEWRGMENDHEWVDLGLSIKWATCNVGASKPEDYGDYFAWGETQPKTDYGRYEHKWWGGGSHLTKYNTSSRYGTVDNKNVLEKKDDVAAVSWGGSWRMPTKAEQDELKEQCTWTWTSRNGVEGYKVTGPNGKSIFLPPAGNRNCGTLYDAGYYCDYWSSSLSTDDPWIACYMGLSPRPVKRIVFYRYVGLPVRPVCDGLKADNTATTGRVRSTRTTRTTRTN